MGTFPSSGGTWLMLLFCRSKHASIGTYPSTSIFSICSKGKFQATNK